MLLVRSWTLVFLVTGCASPPPTLSVPARSPVASIAARSPQFQQASNPGATAVQGLVGVSFYDDMQFSQTDPMDPTNVAESDVSDMPTIGVAGHYRLFGTPKGFEGGLDGSLLFSWRSDSASVAAVGGGGAVIFVKTSMLIADVGFGLYASQMLGDVVRVYAAGGPLVQFGDGRFENQVELTESGGFGVGVYARGGVEVRLKPGEFFGVGVRNTWSDLDFGGSVGDVSTDAFQVFLAYTMMF